jgi:uncharacterized glyoxalase superfamily protein PhnB
MGNGGKTPSIGQAVPELPVADVERAQRHYRDALGFTIGWVTPEKDLGAVSRGNAVIFLRRRMVPFEAAIHWIFAEDVDALYLELQASGADIAEALANKPWGMRQFSVRDADGNLFHFHHEIAQAG